MQTSKKKQQKQQTNKNKHASNYIASKQTSNEQANHAGMQTSSK